MATIEDLVITLKQNQRANNCHALIAKLEGAVQSKYVITQGSLNEKID